MTRQRHADQYRRIEAHGRNLLAVFPHCSAHDPIRLCKRLRRLETQAQRAALQCHAEISEAAYDRIISSVMHSLDYVLRFTDTPAVPVFVNSDPRGYALKIEDAWMRGAYRHSIAPTFIRDLGGCGIIAPEITDD